MKKTDKEITINIEPFLIPISIIICGIFVSSSIFFGLKNTSFASETNTNNQAVQNDDVEDEETFPQTTASIDDDPYLGDKNAKIAIIEFSDYECPFCKRHFDQTNSQIIEDYVKTGKVILVFRDFPLPIHNPIATEKAMAAECIHEELGNEAYFKYHDLLFKNLENSTTGLNINQLKKFASEVGSKSNKFSNCFEKKETKSEVEKDVSDASKAGVSATPNFVIGVLKDDGTVDGVKINGALPYSTFKTIIDEQLSRI